MQRVFGVVLIVIGVYAFAVAFFGVSLPGEKARLAEIAEYGTSSKSDPRYMSFLVGLGLTVWGSKLVKKD